MNIDLVGVLLEYDYCIPQVSLQAYTDQTNKIIIRPIVDLWRKLLSCCDFPVIGRIIRPIFSHFILNSPT